MTDWLAHGVPPDAVGQMVLDGGVENRLYIHTDRVDVRRHRGADTGAAGRDAR